MIRRFAAIQARNCRRTADRWEAHPYRKTIIFAALTGLRLWADIERRKARKTRTR